MTWQETNIRHTHCSKNKDSINSIECTKLVKIYDIETTKIKVHEDEKKKKKTIKTTNS